MSNSENFDEGIDSYQDKDAPERMALARLITKIEREYI